MANLSLQGQGAILTGTVAVDLGSVADGDVVEKEVDVAAALVGDVVIMNAPAAGLTAGLAICEARVNATGKVKVRVMNGSGGTVDEASVTCSYIIIRA